MAKRKALNIIESLICGTLSLVFVLLAVLVPFYYSITALTKPETVTEVVQTIDYKTVIEETPVIKSTLGKMGVDSEKIEKAIKNEKTSQLIEIYADEAKEIMLNIPENRMFDVELIKEIAEENLDKFVEIAEENTGKNFSEKKIKKNVDTFIEKNQTQIKKVVPVLETTRKVVKTVHESKVIEKTLSPKFAVLLFAIGGAIVLIIFIFKRKNGFLWVGIDCFASSLLLVAVLVFSQTKVINDLALKMSRFNVEIIESAISVCSEKIVIAFSSTAFLAFLLLVITFIIHRKKADVSGNFQPEETQEQITT